MIFVQFENNKDVKRLQWGETDVDRLVKLDFCINQIIVEQNKRNRKKRSHK